MPNQQNLEPHGQDAASKGKSKAKVSLKNIDPNGPIYLDARLSKGGRTFNSLPRVDGFPRWIFQNETVEIEMGDNTEILYQRASNEFDQELSADQFEFMWIYRVGNPRGVEITGYLTEGIRRTIQEIERIREFHKNYPGHNADCDDAGCGDPEHNSFDEKWIARLRYESSKYIIEPFAKKIGRREYLLFLRAVDKTTGKSGHRLIVETYHDEAVRLFKKIGLKKGMVQILLNPMHSVLYTSRGFSHTLEVPIDLILDGEPDENGA